MISLILIVGLAGRLALLNGHVSAETFYLESEEDESLRGPPLEDGVQFRDYSGWTAYRLWPATHDQLVALMEFQLWATEPSEAESVKHGLQPGQIDFWLEPHSTDAPVDLMTAPATRQLVEDLISQHEIDYQILTPDVGDRVAAERTARDLRARSAAAGEAEPRDEASDDRKFFDDYHTLDEIRSFMDRMASKDSARISIHSYGNSTQGRSLKYMRFGAANSEKPVLWLDAGTHAREWVGPSTALWAALQLSANSKACKKEGATQEDGCDPEVKYLMDTYDVYLTPNVNPDGYVFSWQADRYWRKTRTYNNNAGIWGLFCRGVDPNRNYDFHYAESGSSNNACTQTYHGPHAFSEPETRLESQLIMSLKSRIKLFISLHSYSQMFLLAWGYTDQETHPDYDDMESLALIGADALKAPYGTEYKVGQSSKILYAAAGTASDWGSGVPAFKYSYTIELRDTGEYGFTLPADQIHPTGVETWAAIKTMANVLARERNFK